MSHKAKVELAKECIVPAIMRDDKYEPVTQETYTRGLLGAIDKLGLTLGELADIRDGKTSPAEVRAIINVGTMS